MQSHGLRKFFDTTATKAGLNPLYTEMLMGHKVGLTGVYFRPTSTDLLEGNDKMLGYVSVMNALTINEENRLRLKVETLTEKTNDNDHIIKTELQKKDGQLQTVTEQLNLMQSQMQTLITTLGNMDETSKNSFAKHLFQSGIYKTEKKKTD